MDRILDDPLAWYGIAIAALAILTGVVLSHAITLAARVRRLEQELSEVPRRFLPEDKPLRRALGVRGGHIILDEPIWPTEPPKPDLPHPGEIPNPSRSAPMPRVWHGIQRPPREDQ